MNAMKNVLVTGGAGFIGSHIVEALAGDGHRVMVLDNLATGRMDNLKPVAGNPRFSFERADCSCYGEIEKYFKGVDWVFHLAALADIVPSVVEPLKYHRANVDGTVCVLEAARRHKAKRFVYTASSSCYGIPSMYPTPETADIDPRYPYAFTKYAGECSAFSWGKVYGLPVVSLRLFNVYGPRSRTSGTYGAVLGVFLAQKLAGKPFTVVGDGTQKRDFVYVTDVARAFIAAAASEVSQEALNVGTGNPQDINAMTSLLGGEKIHIPKRPGEPDCTWADTGKIRAMLGWEPAVSFAEGIGIVLKNIDYWKSAPVWTEASIAEATKDWFTYMRASS